MGQKAPVPLGDTGPPHKFEKSSAPGKFTTSKFSSPPPKIWGVHSLVSDI